MRHGYGWGTIVATLPPPVGAAQTDDEAPSRGASLARDAALVAIGVAILLIGQRLVFPGWSHGYETPLLWLAVCVVGATLGFARGVAAAILWALYEAFSANLLYHDILLNFARGPRLPGRYRGLVRTAWDDWGHLSAIAGVVVAVALIGLACDLALDRNALVGPAVMIGAVGTGKLIGAVGFAIGLMVDAGAKPRGAWSVAQWMILGTYGPVLLGGAVLTALVVGGLRQVRTGAPQPATAEAGS